MSGHNTCGVPARAGLVLRPLGAVAPEVGCRRGNMGFRDVLNGSPFDARVRPAMQWTAAGVSCAVYLAVLVRCGVTALAAAMLTLVLMATTTRGLDFSAWHQTPGRIAAALLLLLAFYGLHCALAGRRVVGSRVLGE